LQDRLAPVIAQTASSTNIFAAFSRSSARNIQRTKPDPFFLAPDVDDATLGATLRLALAGSKRISAQEFIKLFESRVIHQLSEDRERETMQKYGYKTKRAMYKNMLCCWISVADGKIEIKPTRHKSLDSYSGISNNGPEIQCVPVTISDADLSAALREGFKRCISSVS
jgi:hypothetical protein